ncbi:hypothetical protein CEXT_488781 [Caerostris extrusa]|uniref:Uncharacterized protein n=1 Tax=Caerostris extrusa TaxID=172846 RepID=A0AAV4ND99_CAEEX|nr:hypothetical protein CEXT_488781 [Caerostris extrusa]
MLTKLSSYWEDRLLLFLRVGVAQDPGKMIKGDFFIIRKQHPLGNAENPKPRAQPELLLKIKGNRCLVEITDDIFITMRLKLLCQTIHSNTLGISQLIIRGRLLTGGVLSGCFWAAGWVIVRAHWDIDELALGNDNTQGRSRKIGHSQAHVNEPNNSRWFHMDNHATGPANAKFENVSTDRDSTSHSDVTSVWICNATASSNFVDKIVLKIQSEVGRRVYPRHHWKEDIKSELLILEKFLIPKDVKP